MRLPFFNGLAHYRAHDVDLFLSVLKKCSATIPGRAMPRAGGGHTGHALDLDRRGQSFTASVSSSQSNIR
jgi:hypothetical protein